MKTLARKIATTAAAAVALLAGFALAGLGLAVVACLAMVALAAMGAALLAAPFAPQPEERTETA